jgi:hypothetical protein
MHTHTSISVNLAVCLKPQDRHLCVIKPRLQYRNNLFGRSQQMNHHHDRYYRSWRRTHHRLLVSLTQRPGTQAQSANIASISQPTTVLRRRGRVSPRNREITRNQRVEVSDFRVCPTPGSMTLTRTRTGLRYRTARVLACKPIDYCPRGCRERHELEANSASQ